LPLTTGVTGTLPIANGGTNGTATPTAGTIAYGNGTAIAYTAAGTIGQVLTSNGAGAPTWSTDGGGTVTSASVVSANGFAGTVATATTTPAITLTTTITGILKGNGTAISAATSGTDYAPATSGASILYGNGSGGFSNVTIGSGVAFAGGTLSATGSGGTVTSVTGTSPVVSSGGATPAISMPAATTSVNGYLTSTDWTTFNDKQPAGSYLVNGGALGTPSSGTVTNLTGTASIDINGTVGATTANTGAFTTLTTTGTINSITVGTSNGNYTTVIGKEALSSNTTGDYNTALGRRTLYTNTSGSSNVALGGNCLYYNTIGINNTAVGQEALQGNIDGNYNVGLGYFTLVVNTSGSKNVAIGSSSLSSTVLGSFNTAVGENSLNQATGSSNTVFGWSSGSGITTGAKNVIIGSYTGSAAPISATGNNYVVLSDGDGNVRQYIDSSGNTTFNGTITATGISGGTF
jgi:hypothetical protein